MASSRGGRLTPVDDEKHRNVHTLETRAYDVNFEERLLRAQFKRERSSAYWFAASTWGIGGLVIGACLGAYMMYAATVSTLPTAVNAVTQGMAVQEIQRQGQNRPSLLDQPPPAAPER
ncbi:MAG: hypothetical protein ABW199_01435 [Caulobacterales bacterium]